MQDKNILSDLWSYLEETDKTKAEQKVYNWLNKDNLGDIIVDNKVYWFELTNSYSTLPNHIFYWLKKWISNNYNLSYLYDVT